MTLNLRRKTAAEIAPGRRDRWGGAGGGGEAARYKLGPAAVAAGGVNRRRSRGLARAHVCAARVGRAQLEWIDLSVEFRSR